MPTIELKGLRGLRQLSDTSIVSENIGSLRELPVESLVPGKYQPRKKFDEATLSELVDSIKSQGILQPLIVRTLDSEKYEIIAGERRWRAAKILSKTHVPTIVRDVDDNLALVFSLIENIQRENLDPIEEALAFVKFQQEFQMNHADIAEAVGRSRSSVTNAIRLLSLPETIKELLQGRKIEMGHARALLGLSNEKQSEVAQMVVSKSLSVRQTEHLIQRIKIDKPQKLVSPEFDAVFAKKIERWKKILPQKLQLKVDLRLNSAGKGRVVINVDSITEADQLMKKMGIEN